MQSTIEDLSAKLVSGIAALSSSHEYGEFTQHADAHLSRCKLVFEDARGTDVNVELSKYQQLTLMVHALVTNLVTEVKQQVKLEMRMEMQSFACDPNNVSAVDFEPDHHEAAVLDFIDALQLQSLSHDQ